MLNQTRLRASRLENAPPPSYSLDHGPSARRCQAGSRAGSRAIAFTEASELSRRPSSPARTSGYPQQGREKLAWRTNPSEPCVCTRAHVSLAAASFTW